MSDRFFTFMIVPERSDKIRKITLPTFYMRLASIGAVVLALVGMFVFFDYLHVLSQVAENKKLRAENNILRFDVQNAKNRLESLDQSVSRLKSFANKLRVIGNLDTPAGSKLLKGPDPGTEGGGAAPTPGEDSGTIEDPDRHGTMPQPKDELLAKQIPAGTGAGSDIHSQLEYGRSLTVTGELGAGFDSQSLVDQVSKISQAAGRLREIAELEEQKFASLQELFQDRVDKLLSTPSIPPTRGYISSEFGYRYNPFSGSRTFHAGLDIANSAGTPVYAPADGLVTYTGVMGGFGQVVRLDHGYNIVTKYGHNSRILVKNGQRVKRGDKISQIGSSGRSTGPHLHYQVELRGRPVNPRIFILEDTF